MLGELKDVSGIVLFLAVLISAGICLNARAIGRFFHVMDHPDTGRKRHRVSTPLVGGIAILVPLLLWLIAGLILHSFNDGPLAISIALCGIGMGLVGFADDQSSTSPLSRMLSLLVFLAAAFVIDRQLIIHQLNWGSFGQTAVSLWIYLPLMAVTAVGLVNAINMADGQNGVVVGQFVIWSFCLVLVSAGTVQAIAAALLVLSLVVLGFNLAGKLFLGDCGTYGVPFIFGILAAAAHAKGVAPLEVIVVWFFIPVADCVRLLFTRSLRKVSPFVGDRDHFHHRLEDKMGQHGGLACYLGAGAISSVVASLEPRFALVCLIVLTSFYFSFAFLTDSAHGAKAEVAGDDPNREQSAQIIALNREADRA